MFIEVIFIRCRVNGFHKDIPGSYKMLTKPVSFGLKKIDTRVVYVAQLIRMDDMKQLNSLRD